MGKLICLRSGGKLKAITIHQPYASLIAVGCKTIETRSWVTKYRGQLAIHASRKFTYGIIGELCRNNPIWRETMKSLGIDYEKGFRISPLPHGAVIATCRLVDCKMIRSMPTVAFNRPDMYYYTEGMPEQEKAFGDFTIGRYAWILEDVRMLPEPVPARGMPGLWEWTPPEGLKLP